MRRMARTGSNSNKQEKSNEREGRSYPEAASALTRFALVNLEKLQEARLRKPAFESIASRACTSPALPAARVPSSGVRLPR